MEGVDEAEGAGASVDYSLASAPPFLTSASSAREGLRIVNPLYPWKPPSDGASRATVPRLCPSCSELIRCLPSVLHCQIAI